MTARVSWIFAYALVLHVVWGIMLLDGPAPAATTPLHGFVAVFGSSRVAAGFLLVASVLSMWGMTRAKSIRAGLLAVLPQQFALLVSAVGALRCVVGSAYADGVIRPRSFIFADQFPAVLAALLHTMAILDIARVRWPWNRQGR